MPEKANQSSGVSWSHTAVRSQTVEEYKAEHGGKRPKFEASTTGKHLRILTGANVTRKREWTFKGVALGFWGGLKIIYQKVRVLPAGKERLRRNAALTAGQKFDGGINKLVEDMVKGEDLSHERWGKMKFTKRVEALREQAEILKAKGGLSDKQIAERFRINLMESLRVVQQEVKPEAYKKVLRQITKDILPKFKTSVNEADGGTDGLRKEPTFKRSVVVEALREVETFGCDKKKFDAFGGSHVLHEIYRGNTDLLDVSDGDVLGASGFKGDAGAYQKWGTCAPLYQRFGGKPAELEGKKGAAALHDWLDETYGPGSGDALFERYPGYKKGANAEHHWQALGLCIQIGFEKYKGLGINQWDLDPANAIKKRDSELMRAFEDHVKNAKTGAAVGKWPTLEWLCDLEALHRDAQNQNYDAETLRTKIKGLVDRTMSPTSQVLVTKGGHETFRKTVEMQAHNKIFKEERPDEQILKDLDDLDKTQLLQVLNEGFGKTKSDLCKIIKTPLKQFGDMAVARNQNRRHNILIADNIQDAYWDGGTGNIGCEMVEWRLDRAQTKVEEVQLDGHDLRTIEKELWDWGHDKHAPDKLGRGFMPPGANTWVRDEDHYFGKFDKFGSDKKLDIDQNEKIDIDQDKITDTNAQNVADQARPKDIYDDIKTEEEG